MTADEFLVGRLVAQDEQSLTLQVEPVSGRHRLAVRVVPRRGGGLTASVSFGF